MGVEFLLKRNLSLRADYGWALKDARRNESNEVSAGDSQFHFVATFLY